MPSERSTITLGEINWKNSPLDWEVDAKGNLTIIAGDHTDWFNDPGSEQANGNAPIALFTPPEGSFLLSAKVTVDFQSTFDAGVFHVRIDDERWAKLCFEYSPDGQPTIVSVVTRGRSDDCNSVVIEGNEVYLRVAVTPRTIGFHYSVDGSTWHFVRYFTLGTEETVQVGFSAQSPLGSGCRAVFSDIQYRAGSLKDYRSGE
jgi:regulation of enolase protein 1 (concanavalin A-like superfamily)